MTSRLLIVGYGNPLMGDDGVGLAVADRLVELGVPQGARVVRGETDSLSLRTCWQGEPQVWLIDALGSDLAPGTLCEVDHDALLEIPQRHETAHRLSLPESLRWLRLAYPEMAQVRFRLWGIAAVQTERGSDMTPEVAQGVEAAARSILEAADRIW